MKQRVLLPLIFAVCFVPAICYSQVQQDWARKFIGSGTDNAAGIAADNSGNVYICGNNNWGLNTADIYTIRYNSAGTQTSGLLYNSPYNNADQAKAIATDAAGNVYVAGRVSVNSGTSDIVLIKYNSSAVQQWVTIFNTPQNYLDDVNAMALDASGNIYLTGSIVKGSFEYDYLTVKFNASGVALWSTTYNGTANGVDIANDIAVDASGNVFVTGLSAGQVVKRTVVQTGYDYVTIKYNSVGAQLWVQRYNYTSGNDEAKSIALDNVGDVYVTGSSYAGTNNLDCATIKYTNAGLVQWVQRYAGAAGRHDAGNAIAIDGSGNALVGGYSYNASGTGDVLALNLNTGGALLWVGIYDAGSGAHDIGKAMSMDAFGNIYIAAESNIPGVTNSDFITVKYTSSGVREWAARYDGGGGVTDYPTAIVAVTPNSGPVGGFQKPVIYVTGYTNGDVVTIRYSQPTVIGFGGAQPMESTNILPGKFTIGNSPNPVLSFTNIQYELPVDCKVAIQVYDGLGRKLFTVVDGFRSAGAHVEKIDMKGVANGVYHYQITATSRNATFRQSKILVVQR